MLAGELYRADDPELVRERLRARELTARLQLRATRTTKAGRRSLLGELLGSVGEGAWIEPPFHCDYGWNISLGAGAFLNFNCVVLDCAPVVIGDALPARTGGAALRGDPPARRRARGRRGSSTRRPDHARQERLDRRRRDRRART